ncbi:MAG TPA: hypothetical protein VJ738_10805 [Steroidobacteraceae bacterium]|nr:hypothetical protein [Steroidobacteraceae bacterium]
MKAHIPVIFLVAACSIGVGARAQAADNDGCTNATLFGDYAFRVDGELLPQGAPAIARQGVAMTHFDGQGGLTQVDFVMSNGAPLAGPADPSTGFHTQEQGSYKVNPDCTGSAVIHFPAPPGLTSGAEIDLMFVLGDHGRLIHTIVSRVLQPGSATSIPASIHSDGVKMGRPEGWD